MLESLPKFHTLDIELNGFGPFTAVSDQRIGITVVIASHTLTQAVEMYINLRIERNTTKNYAVTNLRPGDRLRFTYDGASVDHGTSIDKIEEHDRPTDKFEFREGFRPGFDVIDGETRTRLSHPDGGGFNLTIVNIPLDHARVFTLAGNEQESWRWQHKDLYASDSIEIEIVETDWHDPFPHVEKKAIISG